ncbi:MAG: outer membrane protein transport protein [Paucibacter sp.]|nr:outer membrane protein transport protein [Roseateles sp.]
MRTDSARTFALTLLAVAAPIPAWATDGYFSQGFGVKAQGQAGVALAWSQDALAAASNPAGTLDVGDRIDLGLTWFSPKRSAQIEGNAFGADASYSGNGKRNFWLPEFGYSKRLSDDLAWGVAVYGNGGMNTDYPANPYSRFGATGAAGVNLEQLFVSPSVAWKLSAVNNVGLALNLAYQRFSAKGIGLFSGFSATPSNVSDRGNDSSTGVGFRLGWTGKVSESVTLGASWASKVHGKFSKYSGLFADGGRFDVPESYGVGIKLQPDAQWSFGADYQHIRYSAVAAVGDSLAVLLQGVPLGASNGPGFGWRDVNVYKLAISHRVTQALELRAGFSHNSQPVPNDQTFFNVLAPGVVQQYWSIGATLHQQGDEISAFVGFAPAHTVRGQGSIPPGNPPGGFGGGNANVSLKETLVGLAYAWK